MNHMSVTTVYANQLTVSLKTNDVFPTPSSPTMTTFRETLDIEQHM